MVVFADMKSCHYSTILRPSETGRGAGDRRYIDLSSSQWFAFLSQVPKGSYGLHICSLFFKVASRIQDRAESKTNLRHI